MKASSTILLALFTGTAITLRGNNVQQQPCTDLGDEIETVVLSRHEWHSLSKAARYMEHVLHQAHSLGTRVWPHAVRDSSGRAGLIIMAQKPLLMSMNADELDSRQTWVVVAVLAAAKYSEESHLPLDHLALTDTEGARGVLWYYDVDMALANRLYRQLKDREITLDAAYGEITRSWKLITAAQDVASN